MCEIVFAKFDILVLYRDIHDAFDRIALYFTSLNNTWRPLCFINSISIISKIEAVMFQNLQLLSHIVDSAFPIYWFRKCVDF